MAGTKNIYNSEPLDVVVEMIRRSYGIVLDLNYATVTVAATSGTVSKVTITPKVVNGFTLYADPVEFSINKLNLSARIPKDMCYSGNWPATANEFASFMNSGYGLLVKLGQWEVLHNGVTYPLDGSVLINGDIDTERTLTLRPTAQHPLFTAANAFPLFVTDPQEVAERLTITTLGDGEVNVGSESMVMFRAVGGVGKLDYSIVEGELPLPLAEDGSGLEGTYGMTGQFNAVVEVRDRLGQTAQTEVALDVQMGFVHSRNSAPELEVGERLDFQYQIDGGFPPLRIEQVEGLPLGARLSVEGHLTGRPEEGEHSFSFYVRDALGIRSKLHDRLMVNGRSPELAFNDTLNSTLSYLAAAEPNTEQWQASADFHGVANDSPAVKFSTGRIDSTNKAFTEALKELTVAFWLQSAQARTGGCIYSHSDGRNSLEVFVGDYDEHQVRVLLTVDGQQYGLMSKAEDAVVADTSTMITVGVAEGMLSLFVGDQLYDWVATPEFNQLFAANSKGRIGQTAAGLYQWTGALEYFHAYKARLFQDQLI